MSVSVDAVSAPAPPTVGSPAAVIVWRKQLKPWLTALLDARLRVFLPALATVSDMEELWLDVVAPSGRRNNPTVWTLLIEALELLELLARVDHKSAWQLLFEVAGMARTMELYGDQLLPRGKTILPRFVVHINSDALLEETETTVQSCIRFIIVNEQTSSAKHGRVRETLLSQWRDQHGGGHAFDRDVDGRVKISLDFRVIMDFDDEVDTGFVLSQIQNVAFAHSDLSLLQRVDQQAQDGQEDEQDGVDNEGGGESVEEEEEEGEDERDDGEAEEEEDQHEEQEEDTSEDRESAEPENGEDELVVELVDDDSSRSAFRNPNPPPRGPFEIESFRFELLDHPISNLALYMINEAGKSGMCLAHLTISTLWHLRLHHSVIGGFLLNQLVPWRGRRDTLGIQSLTLDLGGFDAAAVRAFCTAIAHSRSLREFQFRADQFTHENPIQAEGDEWWPWLAYALFSGDADHNIHKVWLNVEDLDTSHVEIMHQVLEHTDPLAFLFQRAQGRSSSSQPTEGPAMAASLNPSALLRLGHHRFVVEGHESEIPGVRVREPGVTYQVVHNRPEEDYIEFLLPGTGVCWTERHELIELQPLTRREQHPIHELFLENIDRESGPAVVELLALIGEPIQRLTVAAGGGDTIPMTVFRAIQTSCRKLKHLRVVSTWATELEWLFADWTLESLVLSSAKVDDAASWLQLCTHLSDPTAALTMSLRELHVDVVPTSLPVDRKVDRVLSMLGDMLEKNYRLLRFEVSGCHEREFAKHKDRIMAHHNEPICVERAPLPRDAKLAFLSRSSRMSRTKIIRNGSEPSTLRRRPRPRTWRERNWTRMCCGRSWRWPPSLNAASVALRPLVWRYQACDFRNMGGENGGRITVQRCDEVKPGVDER